jgi:photosystem II stability/assembly factor-like uncharacterized protein
MALGWTPAASGQPEDPLVRRAAMHPLAEQSVLLGIARAGKRLVAVGEQGRIVLSDDNGARWRQVAVPTSVTLTAVSFADERNGWAVGHSGVVLHSADGGETWQKQLDGELAAQRHAAAVAAQDGDGEVLKQLQRGAQQLLADGADKPFLDVYFENASRGWIVGAYGIAFATTDGGRHWDSVIARLDNPKARHLYRIQPIAGQRYVVGEQGSLLVGGADGHFTAVASPYKGTFFGVLEGQQGEIILFGLRGNVFWSGDQGRNWQRVDLGLPVTVTAGLRLLNGQLLLADESGRLLKSDDGGRSFSAIAVPRPSSVSGMVQAADGAVILAGVRGVGRVEAAVVQKETKK